MSGSAIGRRLGRSNQQLTIGWPLFIDLHAVSTPPTTSSSAARADETPPTLLIVDDDRLVLATLGRGLRDAGFNVLEADSGQRALELGARHSPALALIDQRMPGMSGTELARRLTEAGAIPFIFLTACADPEVVDVAMRTGALAYLVKPLDLPQAIPTVRTALRRANEIEGLRVQTLQLNAALQQGREISMAVGVVMARLSLTRDEAIQHMRHHARSARMRLEDFARILLAGQEESSRPFRVMCGLREPRGSGA